MLSIFPQNVIPFVNEFLEQIKLLTLVLPVTFKLPPILTFAEIPAPPFITSVPVKTSLDSILDVRELCAILKVPRQIKFPPIPTVKFPPFSITMLLLRILLCIVPPTFVLPEIERLELETILPPTNKSLTVDKFPPENKFPAILAPPEDTIAPTPNCEVSVLSVKIILPSVNRPRTSILPFTLKLPRILVVPFTSKANDDDDTPIPTN